MHVHFNVKGPVNYGSLNSDEWSPLTIIAIIGGGLTCIMAIVMVAKRVNIVGYDTNEAGYGYYTLTPYAALIFGVLILFGGIMTMPNKRKK